MEPFFSLTQPIDLRDWKSYTYRVLSNRVFESKFFLYGFASDFRFRSETRSGILQRGAFLPFASLASAGCIPEARIPPVLGFAWHAEDTALRERRNTFLLRNRFFAYNAWFSSRGIHCSCILLSYSYVRKKTGFPYTSKERIVLRCDRRRTKQTSTQIPHWFWNTYSRFGVGEFSRVE